MYHLSSQPLPALIYLYIWFSHSIHIYHEQITISQVYDLKKKKHMSKGIYHCIYLNHRPHYVASTELYLPSFDKKKLIL